LQKCISDSGKLSDLLEFLPIQAGQIVEKGNAGIVHLAALQAIHACDSKP
jgi:hypothetical protein